MCCIPRQVLLYIYTWYLLCYGMMVFNQQYSSYILSQVTDKLYHIMLYNLPSAGVELTTSVMIDIDCIGSCLSNYHMITATTVLILDNINI